MGGQEREGKEKWALYYLKRARDLQVNDLALPGYLMLLGSICSFRGGLASCDSSK